MLLVRLLVNSRLLVVKFWGNQVIHRFLTVQGISAPNPHVVQGSPVPLKGTGEEFTIISSFWSRLLVQGFE